MPAHLENEHRDRQNEADPEAACHVDQFDIGLGLKADQYRLQRHAADRA